MRRMLKRAILFLLLGAIINVAVAWGLSLRPFAIAVGRKLRTDQFAIDWWRSHAPAHFPGAPASVYELGLHQFGYHGLMLCDTDSFDPITSPPRLVFRIAHGWPQASLESICWMDCRSWSAEWRNSIHLSGHPKPSGSGLELPVAPLWPGFTLNTFFYAVIACLFLTVLGLSRERRRIRRGICPACTYPTGSSDVCTECGSPVKMKSVEATK